MIIGVLGLRHLGGGQSHGGAITYHDITCYSYYYMLLIYAHI